MDLGEDSFTKDAVKHENKLVNHNSNLTYFILFQRYILNLNRNNRLHAKYEYFHYQQILSKKMLKKSHSLEIKQGKIQLIHAYSGKSFSKFIHSFIHRAEAALQKRTLQNQIKKQSRNSSADELRL